MFCPAAREVAANLTQKRAGRMASNGAGAGGSALAHRGHAASRQAVVMAVRRRTYQSWLPAAQDRHPGTASSTHSVVAVASCTADSPRCSRPGSSTAAKHTCGWAGL